MERETKQAHEGIALRYSCFRGAGRETTMKQKDVKQTMKQTLYGVKEIPSQSRRESFSIRFLFLVASEL
jgi:hypothetical protein